jgi:hypothetical protein
MKDSAPLGTVTHHLQERDVPHNDHCLHHKGMNGDGREERNSSIATAKSESGNGSGEGMEMDVGRESGAGSMEGGALGLLFLQQTTPGHPRGDITQAITFRIAELLSAQLVVEEKVPPPLRSLL